MTVSIKKWGNSLALRIPKDIAQTLHIKNNSQVELLVKDGKMVAEPKDGDLLEKLVSKINANNLHGELDTGKAVGNEEW